MKSRSSSPDPLSPYRDKRDFTITPEPQDGGVPGAGALQFVIQKHWASHLHYDLRLQIGGTMKSWAVPKGPSLDPKDKRMAVQVEDHPISYNRFEGVIPPGQYGAGRVIIWDRGTWEPEGDPAAAWRAGRLKFTLRGHKLSGSWALVRMEGRARTDRKPAWLLIKEKDGHARPAAEYSVVDAAPDSVAALAAPAPVGLAQPATRRARTPAAPAAALPSTVAPQLATLVTAPPDAAEDWLYELKFDGYRILSRIDGQSVQMVTRNGNDWTRKLAPLASALRALQLRDAWLDGEVVALNAQGRPDFQKLQNAFDGSPNAADLVYCIFDLLFADGNDLRAAPLATRREQLQRLLGNRLPDSLRLSEAWDTRPEELLSTACQMGFEGVIGKRREAPYTSGRSKDWIKLKCGLRQEFVIAGYTQPKGSRVGLGSLLLGYYDAKGALQYAGNVGTGFTEDSLQALHAQLQALAAVASPFAPGAGAPRGANWVRPELVAEVAFAQWTQGHRIRHGVFKGLRSDKPARGIERETPLAPPQAARAQRAPTPRRPARASGAEAQGITHGERVIDASTGLTKQDLVRHYASVAPLMLEHLRARPVALVRAPGGVTGELFFQKHQESEALAGMRKLDPALDEGHAPLLEVLSAEGLRSGSQMNVIEYHTWNALKDRIERPDRMTFDLDPGEGVPWADVQEGTRLLRVLLQELGLPAFLKTSGGKGLHVVVPIKRLRDWDTVKDFSRSIVQHLAATLPDRFVAKSGPRNRVGRIFVDYLRNGRGATTVSAWSARARPGMGVSVPVHWDELDALRSAAHWTVQNIGERLNVGNTPWQGYEQAAVSLGPAMQTLGFRP